MRGLPAHLETGHSIIDAQHAELIRRTVAFKERTAAGDVSEEDLRDFLSYLHDYTVMHFRFEEELMRDFRYPQYWAHRDIHEGFWRQVLVLMEDCERGGFGQVCGQKVYNVVTNWMEQHIEGEDSALAAWIRAKTDGMM